MITGAFILIILYNDFPLENGWNPLKRQFSTYEDCRTAGDIISINLSGHYQMICRSVEDGEVRAEWSRYQEKKDAR